MATLSRLRVDGSLEKRSVLERGSVAHFEEPVLISHEKRLKRTKVLPNAYRSTSKFIHPRNTREEFPEKKNIKGKMMARCLLTVSCKTSSCIGNGNASEKREKNEEAHNTLCAIVWCHCSFFKLCSLNMHELRSFPSLL